MNVKNDLFENEENKTAEYRPAINTGTGLMFGFMIGLVLDNIGMGLSLGLGLGGLTNAIREKRMEKPGSTLALIVWAAALLVVLGLWIWTA